jgi:hypothetical protein
MTERKASGGFFTYIDALSDFQVPESRGELTVLNTDDEKIEFITMRRSD